MSKVALANFKNQKIVCNECNHTLGKIISDGANCCGLEIICSNCKSINHLCFTTINGQPDYGNYVLCNCGDNNE